MVRPSDSTTWFSGFSFSFRELQREVIMLACSFGNKHCHRQAMSLISEWISSNKNRYTNHGMSCLKGNRNDRGSNCDLAWLYRIPPNVRDIVYCTGVSLMDEDVWEFIWMKFHSSTAVSEKKVLLEALTCSDNRFLLSRFSNTHTHTHKHSYRQSCNTNYSQPYTVKHYTQQQLLTTAIHTGTQLYLL